MVMYIYIETETRARVSGPGSFRPRISTKEERDVGKAMERRYTCTNGVTEKTRFAVGDNATVRPKWRKAKTSVEKREENQRQAVRELARLFNCNLDHTGYFVKLDYRPEVHDRIFAGMDEDQILREAQHQGSLFLRRLKRKAGKEIKCFVFSSDRDRAEDGELIPCRIHNHVVIMGATERQIRDSWNLGKCTDVERLYRQDDYTPLAAYCLLQVRSLPNFRKYNCTRNLEKPKIEDRVVTGTAEQEIRIQPGAKVLDRTPYHVGSLVQYVRYKRRPKTAKRGGHKEGAGGHADSHVPCNTGGGGGFEFSKASWG